MIRTGRRSALLPTLLAAFVLPAVAASGAPEPLRVPRPDGAPRAERPARPNTLDDLFARLASAGDGADAKGVASLIERRLGRSGSDTADLLMSRAGEVLEGGDPALAIELLDRVTQLRPGWAEAWSRRAAAFVVLEDPVGAAADLRQAVAREPRLWSAWAALGQLALRAGDRRRALESFRRALAIHPFLEGVKEQVDRLAPDIDGRDL